MRRLLFALIAAVVLFTGTEAFAENPIVRHIYTADPAALVVGDRLYLYTGHDEASPSQTDFVMRDWHVFSSTTASDKPADWTDHGALLSLDMFAWAGANAWASEVEPGNGKYYWYVSVDGNTDDGWMNIGVAVGDSPTGPFTDAIGGPLISDSTPNSSALNIDPTVFVDADGQAYLTWGSYWEPRVAKLKDMVELDGPVLEPEGLDRFWDAPWMFERGGVYYLAYASNEGADCVTSSRFACIRYATADNPLGPWTERGVVLDQVSSTTNHPAIVEFKGQWYMVYHTADAEGGGNFRRSVAIDRLEFNPDGTMQKVVQTPVKVPPPPQPSDNVAPHATASASYTSPWETVTAINDGIDPPQSNDALNPRWGTWPERGSQWVELAWERPVRVHASDLYFFQDVPPGTDGGVQAPSAWSIQYWTGQEYADVEGPSGYGTRLDQYNRTEFDPVTTTRLRATLQAGTGSLGVLEWKVYAVQPERIDTVHRPTTAGAQPALPETVTMTFADGSQLAAGVWWPPIDAERLNEPATGFGIEGVVEGSLRTVRATVYVCDQVLTGRRTGDVVVRRGWNCLSNAAVDGSIVAAPGTGLVVVDSEVRGVVTALGAERLTLTSSQVGETVALLRNRTGTEPAVVSGNTIGGALLCWENAPPPVNQGLLNTVRGPALGQCRDLAASATQTFSSVIDSSQS